jgi:hypothetical protein
MHGLGMRGSSPLRMLAAFYSLPLATIEVLTRYFNHGVSSFLKPTRHYVSPGRALTISGKWGSKGGFAPRRTPRESLGTHLTMAMVTKPGFEPTIPH